ncbi:unnamed protein product [Miscanthus lutarioriparius]|uniref:CXC domain-containing protein n=1 Tax=Miscanthus lutarioriparius TaxID=422564 RepID=A0A811SJS5_9POAL|nr:unnamed protein product [Miscanthus lutarioriparius]
MTMGTTMPEEQDMVARTRIYRRRGRNRKLKYTWKSAGHPTVRKRIGDGKQWRSKSCKNKFRGCHCAKKSMQKQTVPCFAANRECDPDVCRNCWVSCGDGSLGEPPARGDGYQCGNMKQAG